MSSRIGVNLNLIGKAYLALSKVQDTFSVLTEDDIVDIGNVLYGIPTEQWSDERADVMAWKAFMRDLNSKVFSINDGVEYFPQLVD